MLNHLLMACLAVFALSGCAEVELASHLFKQFDQPGQVGTFKVGTPYEINGKTYYPRESYTLTERGIASWYGKEFHGKPTANGEVYDMYELTAAHRTLQMPSLVRVTNLENGRSLIVRVNDRGPYKRGRIIDLSKKAAELLGFAGQGTAKVKLQVLEEESRRIAMDAKRGLDTAGYELALNGGRKLPSAPSSIRVAQMQQPSYGEGERYQLAAIEPAASSGIRGGATEQAGMPGKVERRKVERERIVRTATGMQDTGRIQYAPVRGRGASPEMESVAIETSRGVKLKGHLNQGQFYPDPVVMETPVKPTDIFVQAGSFANYDNATRLKDRLAAIARTEIQPARVNGRQFYRVRLGPVPDVDQADIILARLIDHGNNNAIIVVD